MSATFTVDASVFVNAFNRHEAGHADSRRLLDALRERSYPIVAPTLLLPEVAATVARGLGEAGLAIRFALGISRLPHLVLVTLDSALARQAAQLAATNGLRGADSVYAAVARRFGSVLVTLDREQHTRAAPAVATRFPRDALREMT